MRPSAPVTVLIFSSIAWGLSWMPLKYLSARGVHGVPLIAIAYGAAFPLLAPILWHQRDFWRRETRSLLAILFLGGYANLAFVSAMIYGEVTRVMVLFYLLPVWGVLGGRIFLGEAIDTPRWLAVALALSGAFLVLGGWRALRGAVSWVDLLALTAGLSFALNNLIFRARQSLPVASKVAAMFLGCFLLAAGALAWGVQSWPALELRAWGLTAVFGLGWLMLATFATQWSVTHLEAGRAAILMIIELITAVASAAYFGHERMAPMEMLGGALILAAAVIEARRPSVLHG